LLSLANSTPEPDRAATAFDREGIRFSRTEGGLSVPARHLVDARKILRSGALGGKSSRSGLWSLANSSSMWRSREENQRLWQAGVMSELGRLVTEMEPVASASVLFDPGSSGGLGAQTKKMKVVFNSLFISLMMSIISAAFLES